MSRSNDIAGLTTSILDGVTATEVGLGNVTNESKATMFTSPTFTGDVSATNIKHASSSSNNLVLASDGSATINQISSSSVFPIGHVIQQKTTILTSATSFTGTATAISGISVTLDNLTAGSDVLIFASVSAANGSGSRFGFYVSKSGTTALTGNIADASGTAPRPRLSVSSAGPGGNDLLILSFVNLDDNVSAGSSTYTVIGFTEGGTCKINMSDSDSDSVSVPRGVSSITCLEIAQ